jgi:hypothetical protein
MRRRARCPAAAPPPGSRLRPSGRPAWESDTLFVRVEGDAAGLTLMLPADSVTRLDVRRERPMTVEVGVRISC